MTTPRDLWASTRATALPQQPAAVRLLAAIDQLGGATRRRALHVAGLPAACEGLARGLLAAGLLEPTASGGRLQLTEAGRRHVQDNTQGVRS